MKQPLKVGDRVRIVGEAAESWPFTGRVRTIDQHPALPVWVDFDFPQTGGMWFAADELEHS